MISKRIKDLQMKSRVLGEVGMKSHFDFDYHYSALNIYNELPHYLKLAKSMAYAISNQDIWAFDYDKLGGRIFYNQELPVEEFCMELDYVSSVYEKLKEEINDIDELIDLQLISVLSDGKSLWCNGHISWSYALILSLGVGGLKDKISKYLIKTSDIKAKEFYEGVLILLDALLEFNDKHIKVYEELGNFELANLMRNVPMKPAKSFREAVQSFYMQHIVVMRENPFGGNSPGRLDYFLWPYLKKDLEKGLITLA